jgi:DNA-binding transcriptional LysR family regulator
LHPHVRIVINEMPTPEQVPALTRGEIDLGLAHAYPGLDASDSKGVVKARVQEDRLDCALVSPTHPIGRRTSLGAADLADIPFLFMERAFHPAFYDRLMTALSALGLAPRVEATYDGLQVVWALAAQGKGWCIGFHSHRRRPPAGTVAVPIVGLDLPWGIDLVRRRDEPTPAVRAVAELFTASARARAARHHRAPPRSTA